MTAECFSRINRSALLAKHHNTQKNSTNRITFATVHPLNYFRTQTSSNFQENIHFYSLNANLICSKRLFDLSAAHQKDEIELIILIRDSACNNYELLKVKKANFVSLYTLIFNRKKRIRRLANKMSRFGLVPFSHPFAGAPYWRGDPWDVGPLSSSLIPGGAFSGQSRLFDQHFGSGISEEDFLQPTVSRFPTLYVRPTRHYTRQLSGVSEVKNDNTSFHVSLDVNQFAPHELSVKTVDNAVVVHGKHQERVDEHGFIAREFTRRYVLPDNVKPEAVVSSLSAEGVLTIEAPKKAIEPPPKPNERVVPIGTTPAVVAAPASPTPASLPADGEQ